MDIRRAASRILGINAASWAMAILAQFVAWITGNSTSATHIYAVSLGGLLALCLLCLKCARRNPSRALLVYGWGALLVAMVMVVVDSIYYPDSPPGVLYAPAIGIVVIGAFVGFWDMIWYMVAHSLFMTAVGIFYGRLDDMLTPALLGIVAATVAVVISGQFDYMMTELTTLRDMMKTFKNGKAKTRARE